MIGKGWKILQNTMQADPPVFSPFEYGEPSFSGKNLRLSSCREWYLRPFSFILPFQLISAMVPVSMNLDGEGGKRFYALNDIVSTKYKAR